MRLHILIALVLVCTTASAQEMVTVGVKPAPPFVIVSGAEVSGFSVELMEHLARSLDVQVTYPVQVAMHGRGTKTCGTPVINVLVHYVGSFHKDLP